MKAAVYRRYGAPHVVSIEELPKPEPRPHEVLIRIRASTVSAADWRARTLQMPPGFALFARPAFGLVAPRKRVLGTELAGEIEAVGRAVTRFATGDRVFAFPGFGLGCHAEYRTVREDGPVMHMPTGASFEEAAAIAFGGTTALYFLRDLGRLAAAERVLVIGASGAVGSAAVQLACHFGAEVTAVTSSSNIALVQRLGAARVIDYTRQSLFAAGDRYDVILDTVGGTSFASAREALNEGGRLLLCAAGLLQLLTASWISMRGTKRVAAGPAPERVQDLQYLKELVEAGRYRPLIDRCYPLDQIVEAHTYVETRRKRGSVVITIESGHSGGG
jgi:NADPH:quinone reductase-like Zn-dependent oxidoreductase